MKVSNMIGKNGNKIVNQFIVEDDQGSIFFQSYRSVIAKKQNGEIYLDKNYWDFSATTGKYRNMFLGETKAETRKKIDSGEYILTDLN